MKNCYFVFVYEMNLFEILGTGTMMVLPNFLLVPSFGFEGKRVARTIFISRISPCGIAFHSNRSSVTARGIDKSLPLNSKTFLTISLLDIPATSAKWWLRVASVRSFVEFDHVAF